MRRFNFAVLAVSASAVLLAGCDSTDALNPLAPANSSAARTGASDLGAPQIGDSSRSYSATRIDVRWIDNATRETGFEVHRSVTGATGVFAHIGSTATDVVLYSDTGADARAENCYQVRAVRVTGGKTFYSTFSNVVCGPFMPAAPNAPSNVTAAAASEYLINLGWRDNSDNETGFVVERTGGAVTTGPGVQSYSDSTVMPVREYCYTVRAVNALAVATGTLFGWSSRTGPVCITTPPESAPPASAYVVTARPANSNTSDLTTQWTGTSAPPAFRIYRSTDGAATWILISTQGGPGSFADSPVASEQPVCYRVVAYNTAGDAAPSSAACITPPAAPTNLTGTPIDGVAIDFQWTDNSAVEEGYQVWATFCVLRCGEATLGEYATDAGATEFTTDLVAILPANATTFRCESCTSARSVFVTAVKDGGQSSAAYWEPTP